MAVFCWVSFCLSRLLQLKLRLYTPDHVDNFIRSTVWFQDKKASKFLRRFRYWWQALFKKAMQAKFHIWWCCWYGVYHDLKLELLTEIMIVMVRKMRMMTMAKCNVNHRVMKPLCRKSLLTPWMSSSASNPQTDYLDPDRRVKLLFSRFGFGLSTQYGAEISKKLIVWWDLQIPKFDILEFL